MICKAAGKGQKNAENGGERRRQGGCAFADAHPTNRGFEIITSTGAQAPHTVGRTRRTEKPPGTRSGRRLTLENIQLPVERLFPPLGGVSRGSVRVGGKTFLLPFYGFSFGYKRKGVNLTLLTGTAGDIARRLICAHSFRRQSRGKNSAKLHPLPSAARTHKKMPACAGIFLLHLYYAFFHFTPWGVSSRTIPMAFSSSRMRSASAQFFSFLACWRAAIMASTSSSRLSFLRL